MSVFTYDFRGNFQFKSLEEKEYELICWEFNKIVNTYSIKTELYSNEVWNFITKNGIVEEKDILTNTEIEMDEKNHKHKTYRYIVKHYIDDFFVFLEFNDELRGWVDEDYHGYVTEADKSNKIFNMKIYYDPEQIQTPKLEETVVKDLLNCSYLPSTKNQFFTIGTTQYGFQLKPSYVKDMDIDLELNYGNKFSQTHENILTKLKETSHGLFLFHGDPGTGKCVDEETFVTLRDKKTGEIMKITIKEFNKMNK